VGSHYGALVTGPTPPDCASLIISATGRCSLASPVTHRAVCGRHFWTFCPEVGFRRDQEPMRRLIEAGREALNFVSASETHHQHSSWSAPSTESQRRSRGRWLGVRIPLLRPRLTCTGYGSRRPRSRLSRHL